MKIADDALDLQLLTKTVQHNCAISDARYSREYSLCIYLLRLREFYRWLYKIPLGASIDQKTLGEWVSKTETHWDEIEETDFLPLIIDGQSIDPFDAITVNEKLAKTSLLYSAGLGRMGQPHFVLAQLLSKTTIEQHSSILFGEELARDIITLPAMTQDKTIYVRHESFTQLIWQMFDEWNINKAPGPMARLVAHFNISNDSHLDKNLVRASDELCNVLIHHELGEIAAGEILGQPYQEMTFAFHSKPGEMQIRAVRDLLADSLRTWPLIADNKALQYLDFWLAGLNGYREKLFKMAVSTETLNSHNPDTRLATLDNIIEPEQKRWQSVASKLMQQYRLHGINFDVDKTIKHCVESAT